jgi:hypothetical protein
MKKIILLLAIFIHLATAYSQKYIVITKQDGTSVKYAFKEEIDTIRCTPQKQTLVWNLKNVKSITKEPPVVTFDSLRITNVGAISATLSDSLPINTSSTFTEGGYCYSLENKNPTVEDQHISLGLITGRTYYLKNLQCSKTYYVRSYAKSGSTYSYGPVSLIKTSPFASIQFSLSEYYWTKVCFSAKFLNSNDILNSEKGICYATHANPTINDATSSSTTLTNLTPNTTYFSRAYIKVNQDVQYSPELTFKTRAIQDSVLVEAEDPYFMSVYSSCRLKADTVTNKGLSGNAYIKAIPLTSASRSDVTLGKIPVHLGSKYALSLAVVPATMSNPDTSFVKPNKFQAFLTYTNSSGVETILQLRTVSGLTYFVNNVAQIDEIPLGTVTFPIVNSSTAGALSDGLIKLRILSIVTQKEINAGTFDSEIRLDYIKLKVITE